MALNALNNSIYLAAGQTRNPGQVRVFTACNDLVLKDTLSFQRPYLS